MRDNKIYLGNFCGVGEKKIVMPLNFEIDISISQIREFGMSKIGILGIVENRGIREIPPGGGGGKNALLPNPATPVGNLPGRVGHRDRFV